MDPLAQIFGMGALPTLGNCASMVTKLTAAGLGGFYEVEYDLGGNELTNAPKATAHIGIEYTADFTEFKSTSYLSIRLLLAGCNVDSPL